MLNEFLFTKVEEDDIGNIWSQQNGDTCHTAEAAIDFLRPVIEDRIISRRADVAKSQLGPLDYYLWGVVKEECYADKQETIDIFKDSNRGKIQLRTIDNVLETIV